MTIPTRVVLLLLVLMPLLHGCNRLVATAPDRPAQINALITQHYYSEAIEYLTQRAAEKPTVDNRERLDRTRAQAKSYDQKTAQAALALSDGGDFKNAFKTIDDGLLHYHEGPLMRRAEKKLHRRQARRLHDLQARLTFAKGEWLLSSAPLMREIARANPDDLDASLQEAETKKESAAVAERLLQLGTQALTKHEFESAERYLKLSQRMQATPAATAALARLAKQQTQRKQAQRVARKRVEVTQRAQHIAKLKSEMHKAIVSANLTVARGKLEDLRSLDQDNPELNELQQALNQAINAKATELTEKGNVLYTRGKIQDAKRTWEAALRLDPNNAHLISRIERAQRVLNKLHQIKEKDKTH